MGIDVSDTMVDRLCAYFDRCAEILHEQIRMHLSYLGEECVIKIRDRSGYDSWFDQTGNLRSSIGYAIYERGKKTIESAFSQVLQGHEGVEKGRRMVDELARLYSQTYALVIVAGMEYADVVEARDNKDVLASTNLWALKQVNGMLEQAKKKALKRINALKV